MTEEILNKDHKEMMDLLNKIYWAILDINSNMRSAASEHARQKYEKNDKLPMSRS